ncbi:unnamed protein product [Camellia sinensis]
MIAVQSFDEPKTTTFGDPIWLRLLETLFPKSHYIVTISCSQSKNQKNDRPFLLEDIFFYILILLPAEFLHDCGRYVCKAWAKIIRDPAFIKAHLLQSKGGLFIQKCCRPYPAHFLELKGGEFKETSLNRYFPGQMVSSSGGLSLFYGSHPQKFLYVGNYVTMQYESLPFPIAANELFPACHIAFVPHTGEYKVVCHCVSLRGVHRWLVLTVGKNMLWRKLETPLTGNNLDYEERTSVTIGGVLYWSQRSSGIYAIDLRDESSYSIQVPNEYVEESYWLLELGHRLSCLVNHQREIHVCILKDMYRSEWDKLYKVREVIDTETFSFRTFVPVGWMDNGQLLIFIIRRFGNWKERLIGAYNVKTGETKAFNDFDTQLIHLHTNGLASCGRQRLQWKERREDLQQYLELESYFSPQVNKRLYQLGVQAVREGLGAGRVGKELWGSEGGGQTTRGWWWVVARFKERGKVGNMMGVQRKIG